MCTPEFGDYCRFRENLTAKVVSSRMRELG
jgi:hypothetical protein